MPTSEFREKQRAFLRQVPQFSKDLAEKLIYDVLLNGLKDAMRNAQYKGKFVPDELIDAIEIHDFEIDAKAGWVSCHIKANYVKQRTNPEGVVESIPLSDYFETGTTGHMLLPRWAPLLKWYENGTFGQWRSSEGHFVSGMKATLTLTEASAKLVDTLPKLYEESMQNFYREVVGEEMGDMFDG